MQRWYPDYQTRDADIVDYREFQVRDCDVKFRGPGFDPFAAPEGSFFTCLGAAQTYGCYYEHPFPDLLSRSLGMPALNLAVGGTGPGFYLQYPSLIEAMNRGRFVILQAMAARHESNGRFEADGYVEFVRDRVRGDSVTSAVAWQRIIDEEPEKAMQRVEEVRRNWVATTKALIDQLTVPVIFFWFSRRKADYEIDMDAIREQALRRAQGKDESHFIDGLSGDFPHYVDGKAARAAAGLCDFYVECLSDRGMGQQLYNRHTGQAIHDISFAALGKEYVDMHQTRNIYYPSAEMHEDACAALLPVVRQMLLET
ncbi:hypothetical protein ACFB49_06650 [Sphingomonas sp. DBB INV C78]